MNYQETTNIYSQKLEEPEFKKIQEFMLLNLGVKLSPIKIVMVNSRLIKRLKESGIHNFPDYIRYALSPEGKRSGELQSMIDELTTHKTEFFRESEHFNFLESTVLPEFSANGNNSFKIWSAGSSTGEEAFTMAMVLNRYKSQKPLFDYSIIATDVSKRVVDKAIGGVYTSYNIKDLEEQYLRKYFTCNQVNGNNEYSIAKELKSKVSFSVLNLINYHQYPGGSFDVIFCRNTLIYFDDQSKRSVVNQLIKKLKSGGYLFVGLSETVSQYSSEIKQVNPSVYKKII